MGRTRSDRRFSIIGESDFGRSYIVGHPVTPSPPAVTFVDAGTALAPISRVPSRPAPRNRAGQPPTRSRRETKQRLSEKAATKKGSANRMRIQRKESEES